MTSRTVWRKKLSPKRSIARRMSPSVTMPTMFPFSTATQRPKRPEVMQTSASPMHVSGEVVGRLSVRMTSRAQVSNRRPRAPPGWKRAKSPALKSRATMRAQARASPRASVTVVLEVGAKPMGQASCFTAIFKCTVLYCAKSEEGLPLMPTIGTFLANK